MKQIDYRKLTNQLVVDIRDNTTFRAGHLKNALNVTPKQFPKYGPTLIQSDQDLVAVVENESDLDDITYVPFTSYILFSDIVSEDLVTSSEITAEDFLELDDDKDYILLDLRHPDEITRPAPEKNLVNMPLENLADRIDQIDPNKDIYLLCGSGGRATAGDAYLKSHGFDHTHVIEGGIKAVIQAQNG